ncbi:tRNA pseudouridine(38-40) synthase TruA [Chitinispirillales bacterium ANBcel5]|uniref:tRNA pseudouridine(38-40) synthase TruA n=1 Tax=Cellulosispirillum alkaliphilum TaxID=3039283 RepID=UPI002A5201B0|nr:tRNA pseudouridine(38-40) synthase TruA [Chitinispirillales bacterium ANBcel5]
MRYFFRIEYDGSRYCGWQVQLNGNSIQTELQNAFSTVLRHKCSVTGAGRTDAGVHARAQCAHMDTETRIDIIRCEHSVNALLPKDIAIYGLQEVGRQFHARFSAVSREYSYTLVDRKTPLQLLRAWHIAYPMNWQRVQENSNHLIGTHDFAAFCASGSGSDSTICLIKDVRLTNDAGTWQFSIKANRFIYKMVRSIVGTLVDIGRGNIKETMYDIISSKERSRVGQTAPPHGLVLENVNYEGFGDKDGI